MPRTAISGVPYEYDIWLEVLTGLPEKEDKRVTAQLMRLPGFRTGFLTTSEPGRHSMRFRFWQGREGRIETGARSILRTARATQAKLNIFVVWRMKLKLNGATPIQPYRQMTGSIEALPTILNSLLGNEDLSDIVVEFKGKPTSQLIEQIRAIVAPYSA